MKQLLLPFIAAITACSTTPETADRQASTLFAIAGGLDAAADSTFDQSLKETYQKSAVATRALADIVRVGGIEDEEEQVVAYINEVQQIMRDLLPYVDEEQADRIRSIDILLGVLMGLYVSPVE